MVQKRTAVLAALCFLSLWFPAAGCGLRNEPVGGNVNPGEAVSAHYDMLQERQEKNAFFKSTSSPLLDIDRGKFTGLDYYPVNPELRFQVRLERYSSPKTIRMATNTGEIRGGLIYGFFEFTVENQTCRVQVYRLEEAFSKPALFIPFIDATSGVETYEGGRYLDLTENTSGIYDLDFNRAYNPYCAYNPEYSCPAPPTENALPVYIRAGEKKY